VCDEDPGQAAMKEQVGEAVQPVGVGVASVLDKMDDSSSVSCQRKDSFDVCVLGRNTKQHERVFFKPHVVEQTERDAWIATRSLKRDMMMNGRVAGWKRRSPSDGMTETAFDGVVEVVKDLDDTSDWFPHRKDDMEWFFSSVVHAVSQRCCVVFKAAGGANRCIDASIAPCCFRAKPSGVDASAAASTIASMSPERHTHPAS